jgi:hypothetical protein
MADSCSAAGPEPCRIRPPQSPSALEFVDQSLEEQVMNYIRCANPHCETESGTVHASTYGNPGYVDLAAGAVVDERNGEVFCSQQCYDECHPIYCSGCGDEKVGKAGDRCTYCTIMAEQGEDAAYAWYCSQHPELLRKPVASVPAAAAGTNARKRVV